MRGEHQLTPVAIVMAPAFGPSLPTALPAARRPPVAASPQRRDAPGSATAALSFGVGVAKIATGVR
jgi:hypothetical protein